MTESAARAVEVDAGQPATPRGRSHARKTFVWDLLSTGVTEIAVFAAVILNVSLVSRLLGVIALGQFLLVRRVYAWLQTATQLGLGISLPRHIAHDVDRDVTSVRYLRTAATWGILSAAVTAAVVLGAGKYAAKILYGGAEYTNLVGPLALLTFASILHVLVYGYHRGLNDMRMANWLQFLNMVVVPLAMTVVAWRFHSVILLLYLLAGGMIAASLLLAPRLWSLPPMKQGWNFRATSKSLLTYGISRIPGDLGMGALIALGPVIAMHYTSLREVSVLLVGMSALTAVTMAVSPMGTVLLSKISIMLAENRTTDVQNRVEMLCEAVLQFSTFLFLQSLILCGPIIDLWVGADFRSRLSVLRVVLLSVPFYTIFISTRSIIDASSKIPYNAKNVLISLAVFAVCAAACCRYQPQPFTLGIAGAIFLSLTTLGILSWRLVHKLHNIKTPLFGSLPIFAANVVLALISAAVYRACSFRMNLWQLGGLELVEVALLVTTIRSLKMSWWLYLEAALRLSFKKPAASASA